MNSITGFTGGYSRVQAAFYDAVIAPGTEVVGRELVTPYVDRVGSGGSVLDVGCGGGQLLAALQASRSEVSFIGVDPSAPLVDRARQRVASSDGEVLIAGAEDLPFRDGTFDVTMFNE